jgi:hypothetical protein
VSKLAEITAETQPAHELDYSVALDLPPLAALWFAVPE